MSSKRAVEAARATTAANAAIALNQESSMQPEVAEAYREAAAGPTNALDVLEQVANTAPPKKPSTTATKSEPKRCAKEGCKLVRAAAERVLQQPQASSRQGTVASDAVSGYHLHWSAARPIPCYYTMRVYLLSSEG